MLCLRSGRPAKGSLKRALAVLVAPAAPNPKAGCAGAHRFPLSRDPAVSFSTVAGEMEPVVHRIVQANIERFKLLLSTETDPSKRAMEICLLAEEEEKLAKMPKPESPRNAG